MAITFDNSSQQTFTGTPASGTLSHTIGESPNRMLFVFIMLSSATPSDPTVTYNSVSMTLDRSYAGTNAVKKLFLFYVAAPARGAHNIVATQGTTKAATMWVCGLSYGGVAQTTPLYVYNEVETNSTTVTTTYTATGSTGWGLVAAGSGAVLSVSSGYTKRKPATSTNSIFGDTNAAISGSHSDVTTQGLGLYAIQMSAGFSAAASEVKTVNGLAVASVKTTNGLAIASARTINGVSL